MAKGKSVLSTGEVARICNVSSRTVQKWFDQKLISGYRIPGSKDRRIPRKELMRFMLQNDIPIPPTFKNTPTAATEMEGVA